MGVIDLARFFANFARSATRDETVAGNQTQAAPDSSGCDKTANLLVIGEGLQVKKSPINPSANGEHRPRATSPKFDLPPGIVGHLTASLKKQWKRYRKGLRRCQEKFSEGAVHQSRVETRRLLSLLELLSPVQARGRFQKIQTALKQHLDTFDELRDTQVQLTAVAKLSRSFPAAKVFETYLRKREERFTRQTRKNIKRVKTKNLGKLIDSCRQEVKNRCRGSRSGEANRRLLMAVNRAYSRTIELRNLIEPKSTDTIHRTRVAFKRFRYMLETLAEHLPGVSDQLLAAMHRYQTMMGDVQDADVLRRSLDRFLQKKKIPPGPARALHRELLARRRFLIRFYLDAADQLLDFWPGHVSAAVGDPDSSRRGPQARGRRARPTDATNRL